MKSIALMPVQELIDAIGGKGLAPGSGAAGAVTLALAAACAAKAAAISSKHHADNTELQRLQHIAERAAHFALAGADRDGQAFAAFIKEQTVGTVVELLREGDKTTHLIDVLAAAVDRLVPQIEPSMAGDLVAARALMAAARTIALNNCAEAEAEKDHLSRSDLLGDERLKPA
jgi:Formiminotransferase-cyclodeaminase